MFHCPVCLTEFKINLYFICFYFFSSGPCTVLIKNLFVEQTKINLLLLLLLLLLNSDHSSNGYLLKLVLEETKK